MTNVSVRYIVEDVAASIEFYISQLHARAGCPKRRLAFRHDANQSLPSRFSCANVDDHQGSQDRSGLPTSEFLMRGTRRRWNRA